MLQTLLEWVKREEVDAGTRERLTNSERERLKQLERENKERRANGHAQGGQRVFCPDGARPPFEELKRFVDQHRHLYGVEPICQVLEMAPSCYRPMPPAGVTGNCAASEPSVMKS